MTTSRETDGREYRILWERFAGFLEEELESAYLNSIHFYQRADVLHRAGREAEAFDILKIAQASWGRATGLRDALRTMAPMKRSVLQHSTLSVAPDEKP